MQVAELMRKDVQTIGRDASVAQAVATLADGHISAVPVVDIHGRIVGVLTATDLLAAEADTETGAGGIATLEELFDRTPVRDLMTRHPITIAPTADVREAAQQMLYAEVHRLFVVDGENLVGVISTTDIVQAVATGKL